MKYDNRIVGVDVQLSYAFTQESEKEQVGQIGTR